MAIIISAVIFYSFVLGYRVTELKRPVSVESINRLYNHKNSEIVYYYGWLAVVMTAPFIAAIKLDSLFAIPPLMLAFGLYINQIQPQAPTAPSHTDSHNLSHFLGKWLTNRCIQMGFAVAVHVVVSYLNASNTAGIEALTSNLVGQAQYIYSFYGAETLQIDSILGKNLVGTALLCYGLRLVFMASMLVPNFILFFALYALQLYFALLGAIIMLCQAPFLLTETEVFPYRGGLGVLLVLIITLVHDYLLAQKRAKFSV
ncbi:hypothetical protein [Vibrio alginolyticus]|uniref:hypothetical protein n=1 Tax=Vibrio alginolyticus TaxID=663 RepID=UPI003754C8D5